MDNLAEELIGAVRERTIIYDKNHKEHKNNYKKMLAWIDISNELGGESGEAMKEKWKNLRDTYKKHKKSLQTSSGKAAKKLKNWVWAPQMKFLDEYINMKNSNNNILDDTDPNLESNSNTATSSHIISSPDTPSTRQQDISNSRRRRIVDFSDKMIDHMRAKKSKLYEPTEEKLDKIDYLFLNYAETFKSFTPRRQALFKLDLANLFTEAELQNLDEMAQQNVLTYSKTNTFESDDEE